MILYAMFVEENTPLSKGQTNSFVFARFELEKQSEEVKEDVENYLSGKNKTTKILKSIKFDYVYFEYDKAEDIFIVDESTDVDYWIGTDDIYTSFEDAKNEFLRKLLPGRYPLIKDLFREWDRG